MDFSATIAILAGGQSRRMGTDKSLLMVDGQPLLRRVIERVAPLNLPLLLVTNTPAAHESFGLPMVADVRPDHGSLGGLYTALHEPKTSHVLVIACDMPYLNTALLSHLLIEAAKSDADAIVPRIAGRAHPLHAVYCRENVRRAAESQLDRGILRIGALLDLLAVHWIEEPELRAIDPALDSFVNLNTPADFESLKS